MSGAALAAESRITYQGQLIESGAPASGSFDFEFQLYGPDAQSPIGSPIVLPGVGVFGGVFTVNLDFGVAGFDGSLRYLGTRVRRSGAPVYSELLPREALTAAPYAIRSDSSLIADAAVSVGWTGITGAPPGFADNVDDDVLGSLVCSTGEFVLRTASGWACSGLGSGSVSRVDTGPGLTGGPITSTGTVAVAPLGITGELLAGNSVSSPKIIDGSVKSIDVDLSEVQARINVSCSVGQVITSIAEDGTTTCTDLQLPATLVHETSETYSYHAVVALADGRGLAFGGRSAGGIRAIRCARAPCAGVPLVSSPNPFGSTGLISAVLGSDGRARVAYMSGGNSVRLAVCSDQACTSFSSDEVVDIRPAIVVTPNGLALRSGDLPTIVARTQEANSNLRVITCSDTTCSTPATVTTPIFQQAVTPAVAIRANDLPVIAYGPGALYVASCGDVQCNSVSNALLVDDPTPGASDGFYASIAVGSDGYPIATHLNTFNGEVRYVRCADPECVAATGVTLDGIGPDTVGNAPDMTLGPNGTPVMTYRVDPNRVRVLLCSTLSCTDTQRSDVMLDSSTSEFSSIAVTSTGLPIISYISTTTLKIASCARPTC